MHTNNRTGPPEYYLERQRSGYIDEYMELIDLSNSEDWSKAMYHNYMTLIRREEGTTGIPINYIPILGR
jgi:hypothetical protein